MHLKRNLEEHLAQRGYSLYKAGLLSKQNPSNLKASLEGKRPVAEAQLQALASVPELELTLEQLIAWRVMDEVGEEALDGLLQELLKRKADLAVQKGELGKVIAMLEGLAKDEDEPQEE